MDYIRTEGTPVSQLLQLDYQQRRWRLQLVHGTQDEQRSYPGQGGRGHIHEVYHILLFTRGNNHIILDGKLYPVQQGTLVLCPPGVVHDFGPQQPGVIAYHEITFELLSGAQRLPLGFADLLSLYADTPLAPLPLGQKPAREQLAALEHLLLGIIQQAAGNSPLALFHAHRQLLELFALIIGELSLTPARQAGGDNSLLAEVRRRITLRFAEPVSIRALARELLVSPEHMSRLFHRRYGQSPLQYRQELRLAAGARLLQTSSLSCKEVAARLGFADVQTFAKAFKRHRGQTPGEVARQGRRRMVS